MGDVMKVLERERRGLVERTTLLIVLAAITLGLTFAVFLTLVASPP